MNPDPDLALEKRKDPNSYPGAPYVELKLRNMHDVSHFTRYLSFKNHHGDWARLAIRFAHKRGDIWFSEAFPEGHEILHSFVLPGNRNHWDRFYLENLSGKTPLDIRRALVVMNYDNPKGLSPDEVEHNHIPIVDTKIRKVLKAGPHRIRLCRFARRSRYRWADIHKRMPRVVKAIARDLGKSGSDGPGQDRYGDNPKYGANVSHLCSEFVSWYYHRYRATVGNADFKDIVRAEELHQLFENAGKLYAYDHRVNAWRNTRTGMAYFPKPGDYLERRNRLEAEHSMVLLRWEPQTRSADVFNGPWPVTLRRVRVGFEEENRDKEYFLGRID